MGFIEGTTTVAADAGVPFPPFVVSPSYYNIAAYADLRVVAMRVDPCFGSLAPDPSGAGCTAQIRLVLQEVRWADAGASVFDSAIHAAYDLSRDQFLALARALVALRIANENGDDLGALAPHPIMVRQGLAGPMSQGVQHLILAYAGPQNLVRAAEASDTSGTEKCPMGCQGFGGSWGLAAFDVKGSPLAAVSREIPTVASSTGSNVFAQDIGTGDFGTTVQPTTTSSDDYSAVYNAGSVSVPPSAKDQAALNALARVENPQDNTPDTIDCASCHLATQTEQGSGHVASFDDTMSPYSFLPDGTLVPPSAMQATFPSGGGFNIHAFSYLGPNAAGVFGSAPTISQRVVNETAVVVEYLNTLPP
jgi:hypothetical protein